MLCHILDSIVVQSVANRRGNRGSETPTLLNYGPRDFSKIIQEGLFPIYLRESKDVVQSIVWVLR